VQALYLIIRREKENYRYILWGKVGRVMSIINKIKSKESLINDIFAIYAECTDPPKRPVELYHYTGVEAVYNIIKNKCFWLTKSDFLNDEKELFYFYDILKEVLEENEFSNLNLEFIDWLKIESDEKLENTFILSFTRESDSLPLWEMYANGRGYNLEVEYNKFFEEFWSGDMYISTCDSKKIYLTRKNDTKEFCGVSDFVVYDRQLQKDKVNELLRGVDLSIEFMDNYPEEIQFNMIREMKYRILSEFINCIMLFKDESFSYEKEFRVVYNIINCDQLDIVRHRISNGRIIPYIQLGTENNIIDSVRLSPRLKDDILSVKGLVSFVNTTNKFNEFNKISIDYSKSSIR